MGPRGPMPGRGMPPRGGNAQFRPPPPGMMGNVGPAGMVMPGPPMGSMLPMGGPGPMGPPGMGMRPPGMGGPPPVAQPEVFQVFI